LHLENLFSNGKTVNGSQRYRLSTTIARTFDDIFNNLSAIQAYYCLASN